MFTDSGTAFTLTTADNALIVGLSFSCQLKNSGAKNGFVSIQFSGATVTTTYAIAQKFIKATADSYGIVMSTGESQACSVLGAAYVTVRFNAFTPLILTDTSTTITIRIKTDDGTETVSLQNVVLDVYYHNIIEVD